MYMRAADSVVSLYPLLLLLLFRALWDCGYTKQIYCLSGLVRCSTICKTTTQNKKNLSCNKSINLAAALHMRLCSDTYKLKNGHFHIWQKRLRENTHIWALPLLQLTVRHTGALDIKKMIEIYRMQECKQSSFFKHTHV